jgi:hypothetical protein
VTLVNASLNLRNCAALRQRAGPNIACSQPNDSMVIDASFAERLNDVVISRYRESNALGES